MKLIRAAIVALSLVALAPVHAGAQHPMRPGRWEIAMQMEMPNMPMQMPPMKMTQCVTAKQLEAPERTRPAGPNQKPNDCKVSDYKTSGNTVTWKIACTGQQAMTGTGEMRFDGDTYEGFMKMAMEQQQMTMKYSGKRLGDCTE